MFSFRPRFLGTKIRLLIVVTSLLVIMMLTAGKLINDYRRSRLSITEQMITQAQIIAEINVSNIIFGDKIGAQNSLASMKHISGLNVSAIYDREGSVFANFSPLPNSKTLPPLAAPGIVFSLNELDLFHPIEFQDESLGYVYINYDMDTIYQEFGNQIVLSLVLGLIAMGIAIIMANTFEGRLTQPLKELKNTAKAVTTEHRYNVRAEKYSDDEMGQLTDAMNVMLEQIELRDDQLAQARDKLEIKVAERTKELKFALEAAEATTDAKSNFLAVMSHELRTPMNGVIGMASLLSESGLNEDQQELCSTVQNSADALLSILNDILDFSKVEAGNLSLDHIDFELATVLEDVIELMYFKAAEKKVHLILLLAPDLPKLVIGDPGRLRQVLINLISNATKFTEQGYVLVSVSHHQTLELQSDFIFCIEDTGIGIKPDQVDNIFSEFTQVDKSTTRKYGGTGLGLAITKKILGLMNGKIEVSSQLEKGSKFSFEVPFEHHKKHPKVRRKIDKTILFVHQLAIFRWLYFHTLSEWGCTVITAENAEQALLELRKPTTMIDLIITSKELPNNGASRFAQSAASTALYQSIPHILLSTLGQSRDEDLKLDHFQSVLNHPVKQARLRHTLDQNFDPAQAQKQTLAKTQAAKMLDNLDFANTTILLAEDNLVNQKVAAKMLKKLGCTVDIAENGEEAVKQWHKQHYDLIFMDCHMPLKDGLEATTDIRNLETAGQHIPIIALTANAITGEKEKCLNAGMDEFLSKPVKTAALADMMGRFLHKNIDSSPA